MKHLTKNVALAALMCATLAAPAVARAADAQNVLTYHGDRARSGLYVVPGLTWAAAATAHLDKNFNGAVAGNVYAQPLFWHGGGGHGLVIVATESDNVVALDAVTGVPVWQQNLGRPVSLDTLPCGNINPVGVTGTPVIEAKTGTLYLVADVRQPGGAQFEAFALSLKDGSILPGWPVNLAAGLAGQNLAFVPSIQEQRSALTFVDGRLYVPFSGHDGDCRAYHGWVVGVQTETATVFGGWKTRGQKGGIWGQGGVAFDGQSLFVTTGNTANVTHWSDGEAVLRLPSDLAHSAARSDFFAPSNWLQLDQEDADLGGTAPLPVDLARSSGTASWIVQFGKDGNAYVLDRNNLGGIGGGLAVQHVASNAIKTGPAAYPASSGVFVAIQANGADCPQPSSANALTVLQLTANPGPSIGTAWCAAFSGAGAPVVTTTDGHSDPIVWIVGAGGDDLLHGYRGDTGAVVFDGGGSANQVANVPHFSTILVAEKRLYVAGDNKVFAFTFAAAGR